MYKKALKNGVFPITLVLSVALLSGISYADCEANYGGGETCIYNKSFEVDKKVRIQGDDNWKDKVTDVEKDDIVEFRIKIKNVGEIKVDDMKMKDFLPDEMERVGGSGLTEYWDSFIPGESKEFKIEAVLDESEFDRENFEKCIVNKAEAYYDDNFEGADTATVCYGNATITELPETGASSTLIFVSLGMLSLLGGTLVKKIKLS